MKNRFEEEYKKLNARQKDAVDSLDGPVMVVAGPGTGKTQILALRIGNILSRTDTPPDAVLCLTFTNSAVRAMRDRLSEYIGSTSSKINVFTFHSFGMKMIEEYYPLLDLPSVPSLMDDTDSVALCDRILREHEWEHLTPRADASRYFRDLKSLISFLKRERVSPRDFLKEVEKEIKFLEEDESSISSRGESKGEMKKEVIKEIESLERTKEAVKFYETYEREKREKNVFDYDDVLENLVKIAEGSSEARDEIRERYLYVLVDEHQDSSGAQNEFLEKVWKGTEKPNIFVVGDDRQLIYGFGGASLSYFEGFKHSFGKAKLVTLVDNYRSTQYILDCSHALLESSLTKEKLVARLKESHPLRLVEAEYPRDEIIACAIDMNEKIKEGVKPEECAILVPRNKQARSAIEILRNMGLPVASGDSISLFSSETAESFFRVLKIMADPYDNVSLSLSFFDRISEVPPLLAHKFIREGNMKDLSLQSAASRGLFGSEGPAEKWMSKLKDAVNGSKGLGLYAVIQDAAAKFLIDTAKSHEDLVENVEVARTVLHLALSRIEDDPNITLSEFLGFIERLKSYDEHIPLAALSAGEGVKVLTLHSSKGLEFDYVWIAHLDEKSMAGSRRGGFSLPEKISERAHDKGDGEIRRELYVAITRAKRFCTMSYALNSYKGAELRPAGVVSDLASAVGGERIIRQDSAETEKKILAGDPTVYVKGKEEKKEKAGLAELAEIVAKEYGNRNVSVSLLNNFFECPWKWYFRNLLRLPEEKTESLEFGDAIHCAIDRLIKESGSDVRKTAEAEIAKKGFWEGKKLEKVEAEAFRLVKRWADKRLPRISPHRENEKSVTVRAEEYPGLSIYGRIDLMERLDARNVRVTDFKTGGVRKKSEIEKMDEEGRMSPYLRQLAMYSYLLGESAKGAIDVRESRLEFLEAKEEKEAFFDRVITSKEIELLKKDIRDYDMLVKGGEWMVRPCHYNSYGKDKECEYCKRAEIYQ